MPHLAESVPRQSDSCFQRVTKRGHSRSVQSGALAHGSATRKYTMRQSMKVCWVRWLAMAAALSLAALPGIGQTPPAPAASAAAPAANATAAPSAPVDAPFKDGDAARGTAKAAVCSACHGPNGNSTSPDWPRLAGQSAVYIVEQLRLFRSGARNNPVMRPLATSLSDQDIDDLAVYYEAQTPAGLEADPSYWQAGEALYLRGDRAHDVPACVACH